jgi:hypothetical protein
MQRPWVLLPVVVSALLTSQLGPPMAPAGYLDPVALASNITAHEAGHFLGSWHTDPHSGRHDLMAPGDVVGAFGYGPDGVGGTADDTRPAFGQDAFDPSEGFVGVEDARNRTLIGLDGCTPPTTLSRLNRKYGTAR